MLWHMTGWAEESKPGWFEDKIPVETYVEADSMDEAFEKARAVYGSGITGAQIHTTAGIHGSNGSTLPPGRQSHRERQGG